MPSASFPDPSVVLYGTWPSPFVDKLSRGLALKGIAFERVAPRSPGDLRRHNPQTGKMPALQIDGERLYDSTLILRRIEERWPDPPLLSRDPKIAALQRTLEDWSDEAFYWLLMGLRWTDRNAKASIEQIVGALEMPGLIRPIVKRILGRQIAATARVQGYGRLPYEVLVEELEVRMADLATMLGDAPFFFGDAPSIADLSVYGMIETGTSGPTPEVKRTLDAHPRLHEWHKRLEQATGG